MNFQIVGDETSFHLGSYFAWQERRGQITGGFQATVCNLPQGLDTRCESPCKNCLLIVFNGHEHGPKIKTENFLPDSFFLF